MDLREVNERIRELQTALSKNNLSEIERISLYDTLTFYLDTRALLSIQYGNKDKAEEN